MKNILMIFVLTIFVVSGVTAQDRMANLRRYADIFFAEFLNFGHNWRIEGIYTRNELGIQIAGLQGNSNRIDTSLEGALVGYYATSNRNNSEAESILPRENLRIADMKLGAAVFQEIQVLRFLADTAAVSRHEAMLQWIIGHGNVTRAEVEAFYRNNVRNLISEVVDEQFRGKTVPATTITDIKNKITDFYLQPNQNTFNILKDVRSLMHLRSWILFNERMIEQTIFGAERVNEARVELQRLRTQYRNITTTLNGINDSSMSTTDWDQAWRAYMSIFRTLENSLLDNSGTNFR